MLLYVTYWCANLLGKDLCMEMSHIGDEKGT